MHAVPMIIQVIFYIAALLSPDSAKRITVFSSSSEPQQFARNAAGNWVLATDASEWKVTGDFLVIRPHNTGGKEVRLLLASVIEKAPNIAKNLRVHDWTMKPTRNLSGGLTVEKTTDGFRIHAAKAEDSPVVDFRVVYFE